MIVLFVFNFDQLVDVNEVNMFEVIWNVKSGQVIYLVRDIYIDGKDIKKGDFIGILNSLIIGSVEDWISVVKLLLDEMIGEEDEIVIILYGEDVLEEEVEKFVEYIISVCEDIEVEIYNGRQFLYLYIIVVEQKGLLGFFIFMFIFICGSVVVCLFVNL